MEYDMHHPNIKSRISPNSTFSSCTHKLGCSSEQFNRLNLNVPLSCLVNAVHSVSWIFPTKDRRYVLHPLITFHIIWNVQNNSVHKPQLSMDYNLTLDLDSYEQKLIRQYYVYIFFQICYEYIVNIQFLTFIKCQIFHRETIDPELSKSF